KAKGSKKSKPKICSLLHGFSLVVSSGQPEVVGAVAESLEIASKQRWKQQCRRKNLPVKSAHQGNRGYWSLVLVVVGFPAAALWSRWEGPFRECARVQPAKAPGNREQREN